MRELVRETRFERMYREIDENGKKRFIFEKKPVWYLARAAPWVLCAVLGGVLSYLLGKVVP
jgi:hypothetical protein